MLSLILTLKSPILLYFQIIVQYRFYGASLNSLKDFFFKMCWLQWPLQILNSKQCGFRSKHPSFLVIAQVVDKIT